MAKVFITGGAKRLGRGLALKYAEAGFDVAFSYYHSKSQAKDTFDSIKKHNVNAYSFRADVRDFEQMKKAMYAMFGTFGIPNIIINNAAVFPNKQSLKELSVNEWHNVLDTNLSSIFYTAKIFSEKAGAGAKIINIASIGAYEIWEGRIAYHVAKAGVIQLTKVLARDLAPNITVNSVSPGTIEIENEPDSDSIPKISYERTPMGRHASVDDIFKACIFLSTNNDFITGTDIVVDGGYSLTR